MKNNRKKQTSSYLLIFLGIVAALLILIILYLTFFRRDSQRSINLAKNGSATAQTEDFTDGEASGFTSGDETSEGADQSGFVSDDGSSDSEASTDDSSVQGPSQRENAGSVQSSPTPEEVTVPYQTPAANTEPVGPSQSSGSNSAQTTNGTSHGKKILPWLLLPPNFLTMMAPSLPPTEVLLLTTNPMKRWILWSLRSNPSFLVQTVPGAFISVTFQAAQRLRSMIPQCRQPA